MEITVLSENIKNQISSAIFESLSLIDKLKTVSKDENIDIKFIDAEKLNPFFLLPLALNLLKIENRINISENPYLDEIFFISGLDPDTMRISEFIAITEIYSDKDFIPLIKFPSILSKDDKKDVIISTIDNLITRQADINKNVSIGIKYIISEIIDNITQHANSQSGYILTKINKEDSYIDICIADLGIGLLNSYINTGDIDITTDLEAIQAANRGISTKNLPNAENRGYGIITSKKMLSEGLNGNFFMMSGNSIHFFNRNTQKFIIIPNRVKWQGTLIGLRVPYINPDFNYVNFIE